jgi:hypothetical protein
LPLILYLPAQLANQQGGRNVGFRGEGGEREFFSLVNDVNCVKYGMGVRPLVIMLA